MSYNQLVNKNYDLIKVATSDQVRLNGLYHPGDKSKAAVILIHGFTSDFYSHDFYHTTSEALTIQGNAIILAQTRGTGLQTEFIKTGGTEIYLGSFYEKIEEGHYDISAFIKFLLAEGYQNIILAGHSLGTIKVVRYLFEGSYKDLVTKLILLAPFDKGVFMEIKAGHKWDQFLSVAQAKINSGSGNEIVPVPEYEDYPVSYNTFYSWYNKSPLSCIWDFYKKEYDPQIVTQIKIPVKVILGENDEFTTYPEYNVTPRIVLDTLKKHIKICETYLVPSSNHTYTRHEAEVAREIAKFA